MKISLIGPVYPYRGGISHFTSFLTQAFLDLNFDLQVISFKRQYPKWLYPGDSDRDPSLVHDTVPAEFILDPLKPITWWKACQVISGYKPEILIIEWWTTFWGPAYYGIVASASVAIPPPSDEVVRFLTWPGADPIVLDAAGLPPSLPPASRLLMLPADTAALDAVRTRYPGGALTVTRDLRANPRLLVYHAP